MSKTELPDWIEKRYNLLLAKFETKPFDLDQAYTVLKEEEQKIGNKTEKPIFKLDRKQVPVFLSELKKAGWLKAELQPKDSRKRVYSLVSKQEIIKKLLSVQNASTGRGEIDRILKRAADLIRTRVDYKFILVLLFLKRVSDKWELEYQDAYNDAIKDGLSEKEAKQEAKLATYHRFDLPEEFLWENIRTSQNLPEKFSQAMKLFAERNPELRDIFDNVDFLQFTSNRENAEILRQLVELFSEKKLHNVSPDILGDAYEWLLYYFAPEKAKEGEVYTPREVVKLLVELLDPQPKESVYDPASASNGMLIVSYQHVQKNEGRKEANKLFIFGQEANQITLTLGRMNLYIHDIMNFQLFLGDTLLYPKYKDSDDVKKFDVVLANPPWNQDGYDEEVLKKGEFWRKRYQYGFPPFQSADWAWIQHMLASADEKTGRVGIVLDNGCLFRGGKEAVIRKNLVDKDKIECVILLPEKLFYNTAAPGAVVILRHQKPRDRKEKILFINTSEKFEKHPEVRKLNRLGEKDIQDIVKAYQKTDYDFARLVSVEEIKKNDYNLSVTRYVDISEESEHVDIPKTLAELRKLDDERKSVELKLSKHLKEIGYES